MHKNKFILPLSLLTVAFTTTNGMEVVPSKKLEKADNFIRNYSKTEKEIEFPINPRPTIEVKLYIDSKESKAHYFGINHYKSINKIGITSSIENQQKMPVIPVIVMDINNTNWTNNIPMKIQEYEWKDNLTKEEQKKQFDKILKKQFPYAIPADLLYERKTNDVINLTVHGYPVIATCSDNPATNLSFKEHFTLHIDNFKKKPTIVYNIGIDDGNVDKELQEAGLIEVVGHYGPNNCCKKLAHGPNGFAHIDKLLLEDKNIPTNMFHYLKQRETGHRISKISSQEKFPLITRDAFVPQQNDPDIDDNEIGLLGCIIS